jgi:hypothetical protein
MKTGNARTAVALLSITALALASAGCSDDVVCPEFAPEALPFVSARVEEHDDSTGTGTEVSVFVTAAPLPRDLFVSISGRNILGVGSAAEPGLLRTLSDDLVAWQPGFSCSLSVTTNYGYATAAVDVPQSPDVSAPAAITVGDPLALAWAAAAGADYYRMSATVIVAAPPGTTELVYATTETSLVIEPQELGAAGTVRGHVDAVAGPVIESGVEGNVSGDGTGFFTVSYHDDSGEFDVAVSD